MKCLLLYLLLLVPLAPVPAARADTAVRLVSLDFQDTDLRSALTMLAELQQKNIIFASGIEGKVRRFRIIDVPVEQAFRLLLDRHGLYAVNENGVIRVYTIGGFIADSNARGTNSN